jgi:hypothetical protein
MPETPTAKQVTQFVARSDAIAPIWITDIKKLTECQFGMCNYDFFNIDIRYIHRR